MAGPVITYASRLGDIDLGTLGGSQTAESQYDLFLKKFSGEVMTTFHTANVFGDLQVKRSIENGKSAQFPLIGTASSSFHVPGESILQSESGGAGKYLSAIGHAERIIAVDHARISSVFIGSLDEMLNHYDTRSTYAAELGQALADRADSAWAQTMINAARSLATLENTQPARGGATITMTGYDAADDAAKATFIYDAAYEAAEIFDTKGVPKSDRFFVLTPAQYYNLVKEKSDMLIDTDVSAGNGHVARAQLKMIADMPIVVTNNMPSTDIATEETGSRNGYRGDFTLTRCFAVQKQAIGTVSLRDIMLENQYSVEYQGDLMVAKHVWGSNILRPECAIECVQAV